jgi:hypothetical protein
MKLFKGYVVTQEGEFYSLKTGEKKYTWIQKGRTSSYERIQFWVEGKPKNYYVQRIMASLYWDGWDETMEANHKDGNTLNNHSSNIEGQTPEGNKLHYYKSEVYKVLRNTQCIFASGSQRIWLGVPK